MNIVFNQLIARKTAKKDINLGNPWEIVPIKNKKYSRDCTEIHLGNLNLEGIHHFEDFLNIEVLWLNDNKVNFNKIIQ